MREILKKIEPLRAIYYWTRGLYQKYLISDERLLKKIFKKRLGRELCLENPVFFNDKLQWLKLNWYDPLATQCADKYAVREVIRNKCGEEYLNDLLGVYESVNEIDIDQLPERFILKATHSSGHNLLVKNKNRVN